MPQTTPPPVGPDSPDTDAPTGDNDIPPSSGSSVPPASESTFAPGANRFFAWMRGLDVPRQPGWIGGVCAGIAARLGIDPLIVRGIFVVVAVLGGPAIILYAAAWLLLPDSHNKIHLEQVFRGRLESPVAGIGVLVLLSMLPITQGFWVTGARFWGDPGWGDASGRILWTILVLGLIVAFIVWMARRTTPVTPATSNIPKSEYSYASTATADETTVSFVPTAAPTNEPTAPPAPAAGAPSEEIAAWREQQALWKTQHDAFRREQATARHAAWRASQEKARLERAARLAVDREQRLRTRSNPLYSFVVVGLALIVGALVTLLTSNGAVDTSAISLGLASALAVLALGIIINGVRGKRSGGASGFAIVALVLLVTTTATPQTDNFALVADTEIVPTNISGVDHDYVTGFGDVTIDLRTFYTGRGASDTASGYPDTVTVAVGAGEVTVLVPEGYFVNVDAVVGAGSVRVDDTDDAVVSSSTNRRYGNSASVSYAPAGDDTGWDGSSPLLVLSTQLGAGQITVVGPTEGVVN